MTAILKNILSVFIGIIEGSIVNMAFILIGYTLIGATDGVNPMDMESRKNNYAII
jgi:hypothetical protein